MTTPAIPGPAAVANPAAVKALQDLVIAVNANTQAVKAVSISPQVTVSAGKQVVFTNSLTFSGTDGKTLTVDNSLELAGTDSTKMTFPAASDTLAGLATANAFTNTNTITKAAADSLTLRSGSTGAGNYAQMSIGLTSTDGLVGVATQASDFGGGFSPVVAGDTVIKATGKLVLQALGTNLGVTAYISNASGGVFQVLNDTGGVIMQAFGTGAVKLNNIGTTASAANVFADNTAGNNLLRSTSSVAYKPIHENIEQARVDAFFTAVRPVWHRSNASADRKDWSWYSFVAEEIAALDPRLAQYARRGGLGKDDPRFVEGSDELVPDGLNINGILAMAVAEIKNLRARLKAAGIA